MDERYATAELTADVPECLAHIAEQEKLGWRYAIGMRRDPTLTDIDLAVRKQLAEMIIGSAIAEAEFQHRAIQIANQMSRVVETSALRFKAADKAV